MKPLATLAQHEARRLRGVLFDLDDTLLTHGVLTREAYEALWSLRDAKLRLVGVTGRPSGWGEVLARQWPIDGIVTENGAISVVREGAGIARRDSVSEAERRSRRVRLAQIVEDVRAIVPEARLSDDVGARLADVTWDIGERMRLQEDRVARIRAAIVSAGARTTQSSVHLHATFDADDKASGVIRFLGEAFGEDATVARGRYVFLGDSGNDAACFAAFATTVGVANVRSYAGKMSVPPKYVATKLMGEGFAEIADAILGLRA